MGRYKPSGKGSAAKNTAWRNFSRYIRLRDSLATTGTTDYCKCVTCGNVVSKSYLEAGHAFPGRTNGILFDEDLVYGQCRHCNRAREGEEQAFRIFLVQLHSQAWYDLKKTARRQGTFYTDDDYRIISGEYRRKYKELLNMC